MAKVKKVNWTNRAKTALRDIYNFHTENSTSNTYPDKVINDIIETGEAILFTEQYQADEYNPKLRRMFVGDYKILYTTNKDVVNIINVVSTRKNPS